MAEQMQLEIVTPDKILVTEQVDLLVAVGVEGEFGVLAGHIPFLTSLQIGEVYYKKGTTTEYLALSGGYAEVLPDKVTILAEAAEKARDIDVDRARRALERAQERLRQAKMEELDHARAEAALARAMLRLKIAEKRQ